jgi:hypothetical protein
MTAFECSPFYNENLIAEIKINEDKKWIDQLHITEANKSFKYRDKKYLYDISNNPIVHYHKLDVKKLFIGPRSMRLIYNKINSRIFEKNPYQKMILSNYAWYNDGLQRNGSCSWIAPQDDDIIILSDFDEIIDSRYSQQIIDETKKRGIVTIKLHFTLFYFNLFSMNWAGAPDYSYRVFIMTGKFFKSMKFTSDELRKRGEQGKLYNEIHCLNGFFGFHHSWLGDADFIYQKLNAYAHEPHEHDMKIFDQNRNDYNKEYISRCIKQKKSIFPDHKLYVDDNISLMESVLNLRTKNNSYFI